MIMIPPHARGIPGARVAFRAMLTATSNVYLAGRLPCEGLVEIGERDINGHCTRVQFMPLDGDRLTSFVAAPDAQFIFGSRV